MNENFKDHARADRALHLMSVALTFWSY